MVAARVGPSSGRPAATHVEGATYHAAFPALLEGIGAFPPLTDSSGRTDLEGTARYTRRLPGLDIDLSEAHLFYGWGRSVGRTCANGWLPLEATQFCTNRGVTYSLRMPGATALRVLTFSLDAAGEGTLVVILKRGWEPEPLRTTSWSVVVEAERAEPSEDADDVEQTEA